MDDQPQGASEPSTAVAAAPAAATEATDEAPKRRKLDTPATATPTSPDPSPDPVTTLSAVEAAARGGHLRGDFPKYYDFHTTGPRIQALLGDAEAQRVLAAVAAASPPGAPLLVSDWGSNAGDLTLELARQVRARTGRAVAALGLELNAGLVARARGLAAGQEAEQQQEEVLLEFEALDVVAEEPRAQALVRAFARRHGRGEGDGRMDVLSVFSTTMWVHLAHGDEGLRRMLRAAAGLARCLVVEPQANESYRNARKRLRRMNVDPSEHFTDGLNPALKTSEGLAAFLLSREECGPDVCFTHSRNVGKSSSWGRDLLLFWREGAGDGGGSESGADDV